MKNNDQIDVRAEFNIEKGKIEEFKKLIQDMSRMVKNNEPDTINYQFYLNGSETKCMVHETYTNSESVLFTLLALHPKQYFQRFSILQN
jgi:quinol monooxygenase YgiN